MKYDVITIGGITEDIMFYLDRPLVLKHCRSENGKTMMAFEAGEKITSDREVFYTGGGGGANAAVSFARLGLKTALVAALGTDQTAKLSLERLKKEKINISLIQSHKNSWSGLSLVVTGKDKKEHIIFSHRAANEKLNVSLIKPLSKASASWVYLASLTGALADKNIKTVFNWKNKLGCKIAWNPGANQLKQGFKFLKPFLMSTDALIVNYQEALKLTGESKAKKPDNTKDLLYHLVMLGPKIVAITCGKDGAWVKEGNKIYFEPALKVKVLNTTGAGDAFGSSLIGGLILYQNDITASLKLALIRSSRVVAKIGAQQGLLSIKEVKNEYKKYF